MWNWLCVVILGIVEGLTEFLPVSSTGHLVLVESWLNFQNTLGDGGKQFADAFKMIIQLGAILAILVVYPRRFIGLADLRWRSGFAGIRGLSLLFVTSVPAALLGVAFNDIIDEWLLSPLPVAAALAVGAIWMLVIERSFVRRVSAAVSEVSSASTSELDGLDQLTWKQAVGIGCFQCLALWPGMSRSTSTILGAMMLGVDRKTATAYSFFAAVPIMIGAAFWTVIRKYDAILAGGHFGLLAVGFVVSFFSAWLAVRWFVSFLTRHTLRPFGWYRLVLAAICLAFYLMK
ncbi:MAG: undecaprenyl-diphosphate phosphatase [Thermoguttaceae bacterium]|nr:undecaprenyl-diphosphate phosphatase [Thermoguttaceae bacterium]